MPREVTISEAARLLQVSQKTIERRIKAKKLQSVMHGARRYVVLDDDQVQDLPVSDNPEVAVLRASLDAVAAERDHLRSLTHEQLDIIRSLIERLEPSESKQ